MRMRTESMAASLGYRPAQNLAAESMSLALREIWPIMKSRPKVQVLDLGSPSQTRIDYYRTKLACQLHVSDLSHAVADLYQAALQRQSARRRRSRQAGPVGSDLEAHLSFPAATRFDVIFAWDIVNYLNKAQLVELGDRLAHHSHGGTVLHLLLATSEQMPAAPAGVTITEHEYLRMAPGGGTRVPCPRHPPLTMQHAMKGFRVMHMYQLSNGFHEHIYDFEPRKAEKAPDKEKPSLN